MSESLRRSSRRPVRKNAFKVGDVVEVAKGVVTVKARLVSQMEGSPSKGFLWKVTYDDDVTHKDEELSEGSFGAILTSGSDNESTTPLLPAPESEPAAPPLTPAQAQTAAATAARKKNRKNGRFIKSGGGPGQQPANAGRFLPKDDDDKKAVSFSQESAAASDSSVHSNGKRSAREQRTARRSRLPPGPGDDSLETMPPSALSQSQHVAAAHNNNNITTGSKRRPPVNSGGGSKSSKKAKAHGDEEVVKVVMLTGTLYLYKGIRRRAEFIRKY